MSYYVKDEAPCIDCGELTRKRQPQSRAPLCARCGIVRAVTHIRKEAAQGGRRIERDARAGRRAKRK